MNSEGICENAYRHGYEILGKSEVGTTDYSLTQFLDAYGWNAECKAGELDASEMSRLLREDKAVVALVNTDSSLPVSDYGNLTSVDATTKNHGNPTAHWVTVLDVVEPPEGPKIVRVYNPYMNQEEFYTWDTFTDALSQTRGNTTQYGLVIAEPTSGE